MRITTLTNIINHAFYFVVNTCKLHNIDESHGIKHSMDVLNLSNKILNSEIKNNPFLEDQKNIIYTSAILHDMCDKKYMSEKEGINEIKNHMDGFMNNCDLDIVENIISTMSYSKVTKYGYPNLDKYQLAYHIVREADLLAGYDFDRCVIYGMYKENLDYNNAIKRAIEIFDNRILKYRKDNLFITRYSKNLSLNLHIKALEDIKNLKNII